MTACMNPDHQGDKAIADGARTVGVEVSLDWGDDDLRDAWSGHYDFCSFGCAEEWLGEKASQHDGRHVQEGQTNG